MQIKFLLSSLSKLPIIIVWTLNAAIGWRCQQIGRFAIVHHALIAHLNFQSDSLAGTDQLILRMEESASAIAAKTVLKDSLALNKLP
jgi:hypothetical protein